MLAYFAAAPINHVLRGETWALRRLQPFAGLTASFEVIPLAFSLTVRDEGDVVPAAPGAVAGASFKLTPAAAIRILGGDDTAYAEVKVSGDAEFAQAVQFVVRNARWDIEEDLARVFGDIAAHRMAGAGRGLLRMQRRAATSLARNLSDYWLEERPLVARRADVDQFVRDIDMLRDDVERLAQRIARM